MKQTILVVDDDVRSMRVLRRQLESKQYRVIEARSGKDALRKVHETSPDLVLLDHLMPDMDSSEICARLREHSNLPIIMLTERKKTEDIVRGLKMRR